ncbi:BZ3500_MvSof-1268-A1-R1_Chr5-2g07841 [Microbotryum saponariae]|uniref:BZ3500_MvSof-1268-A1-R1_Chr5-2g07841 protein n=1 Tax=Microbotryum saponariae TaxID=289078 RepID=A0A2X0KMF2_9BASI|nr:BZ3500_MvSof-1268-A1-R1_Chr5-2g07841 [Microbotryum saponariae]SDA05710.1 BZ3501_MvSof-1269-A2-R1_Chr5-2g07663 [Microbotryum saponariae]
MRIQLVISTLAWASLNDPDFLPLGLGGRLGGLGVHAAPARAPTTSLASTPQTSEAARALQFGQVLQGVVPTSLLATGDGMTYGNVSVQTAGDTAASVLRVLTRDGCPAEVNITVSPMRPMASSAKRWKGYHIYPSRCLRQDCYFLRLDGAGNLQTASASSRRRRRSNLDGTNFAIEQDPNVDFDAEEEFFVGMALRQPNIRVACSEVDGGVDSAR